MINVMPWGLFPPKCTNDAESTDWGGAQVPVLQTIDLDDIVFPAAAREAIGQQALAKKVMHETPVKPSAPVKTLQEKAAYEPGQSVGFLKAVHILASDPEVVLFFLMATIMGFANGTIGSYLFLYLKELGAPCTRQASVLLE